jgi:antitoxin component YwqK of YwqJK toxin-antitoxin module
MKHFLSIIALIFWGLLHSQNVVQIKIEVNPDLTVLSDVTATPDSIPHGRHVIIYKNRTVVKGSVMDGLMDGIWKTYYMNGQQKMKGRFTMGQPHGEWILWSETGEVQAKFQYNHGKRIGHWEGNYSNNSKAIDIIFNPKGEPDQCIQYYLDEKIALNHVYSYPKNDTLKDFSYYLKNYNIFRYEQFKNSQRHGLLNTYHSNGLIWESFNYIDGRLNEILDGHSKGGVPRKNNDFRNGNGTVYKYYSTGLLYSKTQYKNGLKNDSFEIFDLGGKNGGTGTFKDNIPTGKWKIYSQYHKLIFDIEIDSNRSNLGFITIYTSTAPKEMQMGYFLDGYKHGSWKKYDSFGELTSETPYEFGMLNGVKKNYQSNKLMRKLPYTYDNKNGNFIYYNTFGEINTQEAFESESYLDTNWYNPPHKNWIIVSNDASETHQKHLWFYPSLPGMEIVKTFKGPMKKQEALFKIQRAVAYDYWPELIPAKFVGGNVVEKDYIRKYLTIPKKSLDKHVNGKVLVRYKIDHIGLVSEIVVLKSIGFGLDEVAIDMVKSFPPLNPATYNGIPIESYVVREFDFSY